MTLSHVSTLRVLNTKDNTLSSAFPAFSGFSAVIIHNCNNLFAADELEKNMVPPEVSKL